MWLPFSTKCVNGSKVQQQCKPRAEAAWMQARSQRKPQGQLQQTQLPLTCGLSEGHRLTAYPPVRSRPSAA